MKCRKHLAFARFLQLLHFTFIILHFTFVFRFFDNFCKKDSSLLQCGFNPLLFSHLLQWAKATLEGMQKLSKNLNF